MKTKMKIIVIFLFLLIFNYSISLHAKETTKEVTSETSMYYTVQEGDTLWSLSKKFFDSEWIWPDLWKENNQINNPNIIHPGERILLFKKKNIEITAKEAKTKAKKKEAPYFYYPVINILSFIKQEPVNAVGVIIKEEKEKELMGKGDIVYISQKQKAHPMVIGKKYIIYKELNPIQNTKTKKIVGIQYIPTGLVKIKNILSFGDSENPRIYTGMILKSFRTISTKDILLPLTKRSNKVYIKPSNKNLKGKVITSENHLEIFGEDDIAFINKGSNDNVKPGQYYTIYDELAIDSDLKTKIKIGEFIVLLTEPTTSTVVIINSTKSIYPGAKFYAP